MENNVYHKLDKRFDERSCEYLGKLQSPRSKWVDKLSGMVSPSVDKLCIVQCNKHEWRADMLYPSFAIFRRWMENEKTQAASGGFGSTPLMAVAMENRLLWRGHAT